LLKETRLNISLKFELEYGRVIDPVLLKVHSHGNFTTNWKAYLENRKVFSKAFYEEP